MTEGILKVVGVYIRKSLHFRQSERAIVGGLGYLARLRE